ncbi:MAG: hypothetical protein IH935_06560 [Acidobacteria bacterium]|nr:hypothetical protein [Acidobacteriota bacterium]
MRLTRAASVWRVAAWAQPRPKSRSAVSTSTGLASPAAEFLFLAEDPRFVELLALVDPDNAAAS